MARPISDEELELKKRARRRLVGAIVLVTAVAVVLPMVLDSEPKPVSKNVDIQIPSPDAGEFKPKGTPAAKGSAAQKSQAEPPKLQMDEKVAVADPAKAASADEPKPATKDARKAESPKPTEPAKAAAGGAYVIQVEALADVAKAKRLQEQVAGAGLPAYTEVISTKTGELTRVRAGPYSTREAAEKARTQLKKAGLDGKVVAK
jgi:DedD protein